MFEWAIKIASSFNFFRFIIVVVRLIKLYIILLFVEFGNLFYFSWYFNIMLNCLFYLFILFQLVF